MSFDGIVTNAVVNELKTTVLGGRVDKIYQPEKDELYINIHKNGTNYRLILSASSNNPRIYLTSSSKKNPETPPMFCMLLRKHISGGIVLNVEQYEMDRVVFIDISAQDELGQPTEKRLAIEIMGKHSNIILMDKSSFKIIDSIKRVTNEMSRVRQILPGAIYENPPIKDKKNPLETNFEEFLNLIENEAKNISVSKFIYYNYLGLSPLISGEICLESIDMDRTIMSLTKDEIKSLYDSFKNLIDKVIQGKFTPLYITNKEGNDVIAFHSLDLNQFGIENKYYKDTISQVLDICYRKKDVLDRISQKSHSIRKSIGVKLDRALSKLGKQKEELLESMDREKYKIYADLISANLHKIQRGIKEVELENFYDINMKKLSVPLDNKLSPVDNAQRYYKKYSKLKNANNLLLKQIPETEIEIEYFENVLLSIENSTEIYELDEIKEELISEGYLKNNSRMKKKKKEEVSHPQHYISSDGFKILVGKNNRQNDYLTMKLAHKEDIWLHVQNMPGSHVLIRSEGKEIPLSTLEEAGTLAAYFSKGKNSSHVAVDYSQKKNVKKPKNAKTGMVIYDNFKTIIVDPSIKTIQNLRKVED
ncbi:fibronectin/fibrinogen-binding protein [Tissierella creatinini]|nr:fibronectin/fibrinogen-binding protein [Tissierella creatinini]TJX69211.1 fibronectin/fibrinogen-binding protein [Soehngenia saccharolytica]